MTDLTDMTAKSVASLQKNPIRENASFSSTASTR
jgi:hypothetical protein